MSICKICTHLTACQAWVRHGKALYEDFEYSTDNCPQFRNNYDIVEVVHARWEYDPNGCDWGIGAWRCSVCGCKNDALPWDNKLNPYDFACSHYCPYCGAKMDL